MEKIKEKKTAASALRGVWKFWNDVTQGLTWAFFGSLRTRRPAALAPASELEPERALNFEAQLVPPTSVVTKLSYPSQILTKVYFKLRILHIQWKPDMYLAYNSPGRRPDWKAPSANYDGLAICMIRLVLNLRIWNVSTTRDVNYGTEYHIANKVSLVLENVELENTSSVNTIRLNASDRPVSKPQSFLTWRLVLVLVPFVVCTLFCFSV